MCMLFEDVTHVKRVGYMHAACNNLYECDLCLSVCNQFFLMFLDNHYVAMYVTCPYYGALLGKDFMYRIGHY